MCLLRSAFLEVDGPVETSIPPHSRESARDDGMRVVEPMKQCTGMLLQCDGFLPPSAGGASRALPKLYQIVSGDSKMSRDFRRAKVVESDGPPFESIF